VHLVKVTTEMVNKIAVPVMQGMVQTAINESKG
jgi:hypothetical protein